MIKKDKLNKITKSFQIAGSLKNIRPLKMGHINDTYIFTTSVENSNIYILQKINKDVFPNIPELMSNVTKLLNHIHIKLKSSYNNDRYPIIYNTVDNLSYLISEDQEYWRVYNYVSNTCSYSQCKDTAQALEGASCASRFQSYILDLEANDFFDTIPNFHNLEHRFKTFEDVLGKDIFNRAIGIKAEIDFVMERKYFAAKINKLINAGDIPLRVVHNDLKLNNILFDKVSGKAVSVVDLDTVMPGTLLYDFGDLVRNSSVRALEDETDLSKVFMDVDFFEAILKGYTKNLKNFFSKAEKENLYFAPQYITFMVGLRFLTDYLAGDNYFKIQYDTHNLDRARNQFKIVKSMEEQEDYMRQIIEKVFN